MPMYDANDIVEQKKRDKRRKRLLKLTALLLVLGTAARFLVPFE